VQVTVTVGLPVGVALDEEALSVALGDALVRPRVVAVAREVDVLEHADLVQLAAQRLRVEAGVGAQDAQLLRAAEREDLTQARDRGTRRVTLVLARQLDDLVVDDGSPRGHREDDVHPRVAVVAVAGPLEVLGGLGVGDFALGVETRGSAVDE